MTSPLFSDRHDARLRAQLHKREAAVRAGTGGVVGGALGWIAGIGALAIPESALHRRRPDYGVKRCRHRRGLGGIAGGLIGLGIPEIEAKRYEGKVKAGNILLSVHTESSEEITRAKDIFTKAGAQDICTTGEASTPKEARPLSLLSGTVCNKRNNPCG
jgi:hypothetical protein